MGRAGLIAVWLGSCAPLAAPWLVPGPPERFAGVSFLALAALPWVFWLGAPHARPAALPGPALDRGAPPGTTDLAAALPPLACAAALDLEGGGSAVRALLVLAAALGSALVLARAAERAQASAGPALAHALAWAGLVALPPLAYWALAVAGAPFLGDPPAALRWLAAAGPLGWLAGSARAGEPAPIAALPPLGVALLVLGAVELARGARRPA